MFTNKLPTEFPMQTLRKKTSPCKYKNEPSRFLGDGVSFRAKLIGVLEVAEARGDRMCQEALADLKMAVRAAGEHKQRIQVHVAIDGLRLRDDKTGDSLYHHPVHKISFIAQDMTDSRAFGYIFGSPDTGHRFFGIKTDKAASQVVIAMRDLFQVVFELKKKEIELAKQQLEGKSTSSVRYPIAELIKSNFLKSKNTPSSDDTKASSVAQEASGGAGGVAELVDLEQELSSLRRGLTQVEGLTPDPFGDSFTPPATDTKQKGSLLPPPPGARGRTTSTTRSSNINFSPSRSAQSQTHSQSVTPALGFELSREVTASAPASFTEKPDLVPIQNATNPQSLAFDVFTDLDPLGTGRSKPYVDKKLFFQELKNPPKKILKDLVPMTNTVTLLSEILPITTESKVDMLTTASVGRHSGGSVSIMNPPSMTQTISDSMFSSDPFAETDPFDNTDPFTDFKDDPFNNTEFSSSNFAKIEELKRKLSRGSQEEKPAACGVAKNIFNGPLQVSLPPEPVPKSPRMQRQMTESSSIRQRPTAKLGSDGASPPPPLPPKKVESHKPPPRPPYSDVEVQDSGAESGPGIPRPARRKEPYVSQPDRTLKPRLSSATTNSSEDEYLTPVPPPLPGGARARRQQSSASTLTSSGGTAPTSGLDMTLSQLTTCGLDELATRLKVPVSYLSSMTLAQLTARLQEYISSYNRPTEPAKLPEPARPPLTAKTERSRVELKTNFEDNFAASPLSAASSANTFASSSTTFVANFDDFEKKAADPSFDRYAAFREIQEEEFKSKSLLDPPEEAPPEIQEPETKEDKEVQKFGELLNGNSPNPDGKSPLKSLDELTMDSLNALYATSVSPKPSEIDTKLDDVKSIMKNLKISTDTSRRSVTPKEAEPKSDLSDRYAALREISIVEPTEEYESIPPDAPKERKRSDEKSDGFDNSDFFDCIDNSSLSFSHVEDAFRKSPCIREETKDVKVERLKPQGKPVGRNISPHALSPPARMSTGSLSDIGSASSPEVAHKDKSSRAERRDDSAPGAWSVFRRSPRSDEAGSPWSSDSKDSETRKWDAGSPELPRPRRRPHKARPRQTSSSSRDVSPWEEDQPPPARHHRTSTHSRESRHGSSGSRERLDSGSGREKRPVVTHRDRDRRELSKERDVRGRDKRTRERDGTWERDREYSREREREREYREAKGSRKERERDKERHRRPHHSWGDEEDVSDGDNASNVSTPGHERWGDHRSYRRDEYGCCADRQYGSLSWRRRRTDSRQSDDTSERDRRYGATLSSSGRRSAGARPREPRDPESRRRSRRDPPREPHTRHKHRDRFRFSNDFSEHDSPREQSSPFENDFVETPSSAGPRKKGTYSSLEGTRFAFEQEEETPSPQSVSKREPDLSATRFRFDSDSISQRSLFEDDFTESRHSIRPQISVSEESRYIPRPATSVAEEPRHTVRPATSIAEEDETGVEPTRAAETNGRRSRPKPKYHQDIKKSESVNIFARDTDPFDGDDFFACTGSDRAARRDNWPSDFQAFDRV